jgi:hypothetical protein
VLAYVPEERRRELYRVLAEAGDRAPLAFVGVGPTDEDVPTYQTMRIQLWPGGEREVVAHADFHGAWIDWLV